ncbi:MAG: hypothetical protein JRM95_03460 [Nitrososphaerota archaeon]|nr:hypothetical protein [Nitrososphaerota archaeon]
MSRSPPLRSTVPIYVSRPEEPEPIYVAFLKACVERAQEHGRRREKAMALPR